MKHCGETNFYLCEINRDMVIDATYKGNKSRYINHSCCPNTEMQKWWGRYLFLDYGHICFLFGSHPTFPFRTIDGETRIGIFATRDIRKGEHLTYDYQYGIALDIFKAMHYASTDCFTFKRSFVYCVLINVAGLFNLVPIKNVTAALQAAGKSWELNPVNWKCLQMLHWK